MKTNLPTSKSDNLLGTQTSRLRGPRKQREVGCSLRAFWNKTGKYLIIAFFLLAFLLAFLNACKSPAILTNADNHHSRDSNYHANYERIETHDTIIYCPSTIFCPGAQASPPAIKKNMRPSPPADFPLRDYPCSHTPIIRISDRTRTIRDTTFLLRTDTLLRTQTITQTERYIPPFYKFCTITFVAFIAFVAIYFSIRLLFRYLKIRSPT